LQKRPTILSILPTKATPYPGHAAVHLCRRHSTGQREILHTYKMYMYVKMLSTAKSRRSSTRLCRSPFKVSFDVPMSLLTFIFDTFSRAKSRRSPGFTRLGRAIQGRGGGLGSRPKNMYGETLGDGVEYHLMKPTPRR